MDTPVLHHVGIGVQDEKSLLTLFLNKLDFHVISTRVTEFDKKWVLSKDRIVFTITRVITPINMDAFDKAAMLTYSTENLPHFSTDWHQFHPECPSKKTYIKCKASSFGSVYEISFQVKDVASILKRALLKGAQLVRPLSRVSDRNGVVSYATFMPPIGNIHHTIIDMSEYSGIFLPGFEISTHEPRQNSTLPPLTVDHITIAVSMDETASTLRWYQNVFKMTRFIINKNENNEDGLHLSNIGMKLAAMEYWKCSEDGLSMGNDKNSLKIVIGESLSTKPNQLSSFLKNHQGSGIQHIGFKTDDLVNCVNYLKKTNLPCLQPPTAYYDEVCKRAEIEGCGLSVTHLENCGILLDSEADGEELENSGENQKTSCRYLMQIFTKPIFGDDTFFLEFLERRGANGFGAGNITALWKAVQSYLIERENDFNNESVTN